MQNAAPVNIAFCVNDGYVPYITVTIKSIAENHRHCDVGIHILTDKLSDAGRKRLAETVDGYDNVTLNIYLVNDELLRDLKTGVWPIYIWYRVLLPEILPSDVDRVLYLDADTLVVDNLQELFSLDMTDKAVAGSRDVQSFEDWTFVRCRYDREKGYICSGVLLMNLEYWRQHRLTQVMIEWAHANAEHLADRYAFPDQDTINVVCQDCKMVLPFRYNILGGYFIEPFVSRDDCRTELKDCIEHPAIVHYAGCYPWIKIFANHPMQDEWVRYNNMLPHRVRTSYILMKWRFIKTVVWPILHPFRFKRRKVLTAWELKKRFCNGNIG